MTGEPSEPTSPPASRHQTASVKTPVHGWQALPVRLARNFFWSRVFPFLRWFPISPEVLRGDLIAGMIGALVLVPKAMAYAQLSGLPVYFGLYAAFIPAIIGALWGSSRQLLTGPVAVISLMTASALAPFAIAGSDQYIGLALLLALLVGVIQIGMGVFKLGVIVNFISHPVIIGFINAAAIIIALSQFNKLLGIPLGRSDAFLVDIWEMLRQIGNTHLPTLGMGLLAFAIMWAMKKFTPEHIARTSVLVAVVVTILVSWAVGFEHNRSVRIEQVSDANARSLLSNLSRVEQRIVDLNAQITDKSQDRTGTHTQRAGARIRHQPAAA
jgi:SulP family sulfate permease